MKYMYVGDRFENFHGKDHKRFFLFQESSLFAVSFVNKEETELTVVTRW